MKNKKPDQKEYRKDNRNETQKPDQKEYRKDNSNETQKTDQKISLLLVKDSIPESADSNFILQSPISLTYYDSNDDEHAILDDDIITPSELSDDETMYTLSI